MKYGLVPIEGQNHGGRGTHFDAGGQLYQQTMPVEETTVDGLHVGYWRTPIKRRLNRLQNQLHHSSVCYDTFKVPVDGVANRARMSDHFN